MANDALPLTLTLASVMRDRDDYRRIAREILNLIHEGQSRGLQDATVNRMTTRYDVAAMGRLEAELERLESGSADWKGEGNER